MRKFLLTIFCAIAIAISLPAYAQATKATAQSITCAASGSSTLVAAAAASRESVLIANTSGGTIRIAPVASGTPALTDLNSIQLLAGQNFTDTQPGVYIGRWVCANNAAGTATVYVIETKRLN